ncbi:hypothetical protein SDC9_126935 [bioreactor metagenome]|uniref:Uncharacterized protein n=1 Tax=bioreactor metagenome TaxID=1076179 RepID=A0A645CSK1_9ZZZZ
MWEQPIWRYRFSMHLWITWIAPLPTKRLSFSFNYIRNIITLHSSQRCSISINDMKYEHAVRRKKESNRQSWQYTRSDCLRKSQSGRFSQSKSLRFLRFKGGTLPHSRRSSFNSRTYWLCCLYMGHQRITVIGTGTAPAQFLN